MSKKISFKVKCPNCGNTLWIMNTCFTKHQHQAEYRNLSDRGTIGLFHLWIVMIMNVILT